MCVIMGVQPDEVADEELASRCLEAWLRDFGTVDTSLIESFLEDIDAFSPDTTLSLMSPENAAGDTEQDEESFYYGPKGLRRAVLRFLSGVFVKSVSRQHRNL